MATKHNHQVVFGNREAGCPRCAELAAGAPAVKSWGWRNKEQEARKLSAIKAHDFAECAKSHGGVCTCFDW